jgi:hypothetical protein
MMKNIFVLAEPELYERMRESMKIKGVFEENSPYKRTGSFEYK